eukprot:Polyplicarium_translucidae@DN2615_c0_g1_i2.p1
MSVDTRALLEDLYYLDSTAEELSWKPISLPSWQRFGPRKHHASAFYDEHLYVFGGKNAVSGGTPGGTATPLRNRCGDVWRCKAMAERPEGEFLKATGEGPGGITDFGHVLVHDSWLIFGGCGPSGAAVNTIYNFNIKESEWAKVDAGVSIPSLTNPVALLTTAGSGGAELGAIQRAELLVIFGGSDSQWPHNALRVSFTKQTKSLAQAVNELEKRTTQLSAKFGSLDKATKKFDDLISDLEKAKENSDMLDSLKEDSVAGPVIRQVLQQRTPLSRNCFICSDRPKEVFFEPCGHFLACENCSKTLMQKSSDERLCPMCRAALTGSRRVYDS